MINTKNQNFADILMIKRIVLILTGCLTVIFAFHAKSQISVQNHRGEYMKYKNYTELQRAINNIALSVCDLTNPEDLRKIHEFVEIYESSDIYFDTVVTLYADIIVTDLHKEIAGYAMQSLSIENKVSLISKVADLTEQKIVNGHLLQILAFPPLNWSAQMTVNYDRNDVKAILKRLANMDELNSERRKYILEEVLTGRAKEDFLELKEMEQIP